MGLLKYFYFKSNTKKNPKRATVRVTHDEIGTVCVSVVSPGRGGFSMGSELTPTEAREMAAGLIELADIAENEERDG